LTFIRRPERKPSAAPRRALATTQRGTPDWGDASFSSA
jgi:hypothetical protein